MRHDRFKIVPVLICMAVLGMAVLAFAQGGDSEKEIHGLIAKCADALQNQNWEKLAGICSDDWVHFSHTGERWDMAATKGMFETHITDHTIEFNNVDVHVSDDASMAWATFDETTEYKFDGNPVKQDAIFTAIFEKEEDNWKMQLLHRTVVAPPMEH